MEELFFFVIQTYNTSLLYCLLTKPTFHPVYLRSKIKNQALQFWRWTGIVLVASAVVVGAWMIESGGPGFYMGLIICWAGPFCLLLWSVLRCRDGISQEVLTCSARTLAYQFIILLPSKDTLLPIVLPTLYLWLVDTLALRRGTWVIEDGTKLSWQLWDGLEIE